MPMPQRSCVPYARRLPRWAGQATLPHGDAIRLLPTSRGARALRQKFPRRSHTHSEDEVRFFVEGRGCSACIWGRVAAGAFCGARRPDRVAAAAGHCSSNGSSPRCTALRFFNQPRRLGGQLPPATRSPSAFRCSPELKLFNSRQNFRLCRARLGCRSTKQRRLLSRQRSERSITARSRPARGSQTHPIEPEVTGLASSGRA